MLKSLHVYLQHLEDTHALKAHCQALLDRLWAEFQEQTQNYRKATEERKMRFEALKRKDEESANTIAKQMKKIQRLQVRRVAMTSCTAH